MYKFLRFFSGILFALGLSVLSCQSPAKEGKKSAESGPSDRKWWKEAVVYQIYPRSFKDVDGDGVGDLKGIISKLDYIKSLGVDAVWLNPIYQSPNDDNGYDVSDYYNILPEFGTMEDFDALLKGMHDRGIKLVMDVVVNHSSSEHAWFKQSRSSRTNPYRDYYHWFNAERGKPTPRYSFFDVNSDAWKYDTLTNAYYLHYFSQKQPDLNWENPKLRQEIYKMLRFWLDKGVDGLRMDAFQYVAKDTTFPKFPKGYEKNIIKYYSAGPNLHEYIQEMDREVMSKYNIMTVSEGAGANSDDAMKFVDPARHEFSMAYHFDGIDYGHYNPDYELTGFKKIYSHWDSAFTEKGWLSIFLANHDQPRMVSHWGNDNPAFRDTSSKMLTTFVLTMRGTPYYYYGDELGMENIRFDRIEDYHDVSTTNKYEYTKQHHLDLRAFVEEQKRTARGNGRTPFQWDGSANAGFTTGVPWIKVNPDYKTVNEAAEEKDSNSCLNYFKKIIQLRKNNLALVYGKYTLLDPENPDVYAYTRELDGKKFLILLNFKNKTAKSNTGLDLTKSKLVLWNYAAPGRGETLRPYESAVYEL